MTAALLLALLSLAWADPVEESIEAPAEGVVPDDGEAPEPDLPRWQRKGWGWGALPAVNYNSDEGFGFGAIGSIYRYDGKTAPYKWSSTLLVFFTTKAVQSHRIDLDVLDIGGTGLRITSRIALDVTKTANYCGVGRDVTCDTQEAEDAADALGLTGDDRDDFVRRYYRLRWVRPYGYINARYRIGDFKPKTELLLAYFGGFFHTGDFKVNAPYPGSLYEQDYGTTGENGFTSVIQAGIMVDTRDNEPAPRRGHWHELTIRGSDKWLGSAWQFFGFNLTSRMYAPLVDDRLTLASRTVFDGVFGDQHVRMKAQPGGFTLYSFGGGDIAGRGIRLRRYTGNVKAMEQLSLRWAFWRPQLFGSRWELTWMNFTDVLIAADQWSDLGDALSRPIVGFGTGLRIAPEPNFIVRFDMGFSPVENYSPGIYIDVGHLF